MNSHQRRKQRRAARRNIAMREPFMRAKRAEFAAHRNTVTDSINERLRSVYGAMAPVLSYGDFPS